MVPVITNQFLMAEFSPNPKSHPPPQHALAPLADLRLPSPGRGSGGPSAANLCEEWWYTNGDFAWDLYGDLARFGLNPE